MKDQLTPQQIRWSYLLGAVICAVGIIIFWVAVGSVAWNTARNVQKITLPGEAYLKFRKPGIYLGVYSHRGEDPVPMEALSGLSLSLTNTFSGQPLPLAKMPPAAFSMAGQQGVALFQTEAPEAGEYILKAVYGGGAGPNFEAFVMHESLANNRSDLAAGVIFCLVLLVSGGVILYRTSRQAKALAVPAAPPVKKKK